MVNVEELSATLVRKHFAKQNITKLSDIEKQLTAFSEKYYLRGLINFHVGERRGLRSSTGHYTASALQSNSKWETYDDTKTAIQHTKQTFDVEFLIYTI
jgi:ubiquitin C-terminal hydrolase